MRIGCDCRPLFEIEPSGVTEYTRHLFTSLINQYPRHNFVLFYQQWKSGENFLKSFSQFPNVEIRFRRIPNKILNSGISLFNWPVMDSWLSDIDLIFFPNLNFMSLSPRIPSVIAIHDLSFHYFSSLFSPFRKTWHLAIHPRHLVKAADACIAVSHATKNDLMEWAAIPEDKIHVIYEGIDPIFFQPVSEVEKKFVREKYGLPRDYIFMLSNHEKRKNFEGAITSFLLFQKTARPSPVLVIGGGRGWGGKKFSSVHPRIRDLGYISDLDRKPLVAGARVFLFPSIAEGFGLPPLEAMACGTPVIASTDSAVSEICGDAALLIHPFHIEDMTNAISMVWDNENFRSRLIAKGKNRAKFFQWSDAAEKTMDVFHHIVHAHAYRH